jgi:hypothetical protein
MPMNSGWATPAAFGTVSAKQIAIKMPAIKRTVANITTINLLGMRASLFAVGQSINSE